MQTDPRATQMRDSRAVGQRCRSHSDPRPQQHTVTAIARIWFRVPCGPIGLQISVTEMALNPNIISAITRQVVR